MDLADAFGVIIVARRLEELLEAAVIRVNCKRAAMLIEAMFRERMMQHPATLLRLYQTVSVAMGQMEEERGEADGDDHDQYQQHVAMVWHCGKKGPYFRDQVPLGTFLTIRVPIYNSGSLFSVFWQYSRKEMSNQSACTQQ